MTCLCLLPGQSTGSDAAPRAIFGVYAHAGQHDYIRVMPAAGEGKVEIALKLYYANGHVCQLEKAGDWQRDRVLIVTEGLVENEPCRLEASFVKGGVVLKDEGQRCARLYCGTRGKLDGVTVPKRNTHK